MATKASAFDTTVGGLSSKGRSGLFAGFFCRTA